MYHVDNRLTSIPYVEIGWMVTLLLPLYFIRINKWLNPFLWYVWVLAVYKTQNPSIRADFPIPVILAAENQALYVMILLLVFIALLKSKLETSLIEEWLKYLGIYNVLLSFFLLSFNEPFISGLILNKPMNGVFNLMLLPFIPYRWVWALGITSCLLSKSVTVYLVLLIFLNRWLRKINYVAKALILVGVMSTTYALIPTLSRGGFRLEAWAFFFKSFTTSDLMIGRGPGSFFPFSSFEQQRQAFLVTPDLQRGEGLLIWFHNDYLQLLYEYGVVGALLFIPVGLWAVRHLKKYPLSLIALSIGCLTYYPCHWSLHLIVIFLMLKIANNNYKEEECKKLQIWEPSL